MRLPAFPRSRTSLAALISGGVARHVALTVFVCGLIANAVAAVPSYMSAKERFAEGVREQSIALFVTAVDPTRYPRVESLRDLGETLTAQSNIAGGTIYSGAGEERGQFGTPPSLDWTSARLGRVVTRFTPLNGSLETFLAPEVTGIPYGIMIRLDAGDDWARVVAEIQERFVLSALAALIVAIASGIAVSIWVTQPVRSIGAAVDNALNDPAEATKLLARVPRRDELGRLAQAIDQLLFFTAASHDEELMPALMLLDQCAHGILVLSADGHLISANMAALRLFGVRSLEALRARPPDRLLRFDNRPADPLVLLGKGPVIGHGEVMRNDGEIPCLVSGDTIRARSGEVSRRFIMLVDMRGLLDEVRNEVLNRQRAEQEVARLALDLRRVRRAFAACLVMLELDGAEAPKANAVTVLPDELVDGWVERLASESTATPPNLFRAVLPPLLGDPGELRRLVDTALEIVRMRSAAQVPQMKIAAMVDDADTAMFLISEVLQERGGEAVAPITGSEDVAIYIASLSVLCRRQQGSLQSATGTDNGNVVAVRLRIDRTTMDLTSQGRSAA